jgi:hypothetical protein
VGTASGDPGATVVRLKRRRAEKISQSSTQAAPLKERQMVNGVHKPTSTFRSALSSRANIVLLGFLAVTGYFLVTEHWAHVVPFLPWMLVLACPLMHVFMHGGHGGHGGSDEGGRPPTDSQDPPH